MGEIAQRDIETAEKVLAEMRGGDIFDLSPTRSRMIIARAIDAEREACAQTADEARRGGNPEGAADAIRARGSK